MDILFDFKWFSLLWNQLFKKNTRIFQIFLFLFFIVQLLPSLLIDWSHIYYEMFCWVSVLSDAILTLLLSFVFKTDTKFLMQLMFVVVVVWYCCCSWLFFLILAYVINLMHHFLLHWVICFGGYLFVRKTIFW